MYKIYADTTLIYDSTLDDYRIGRGSITLETNKSGSFSFSVYPEHFYYDLFVRLKTVITVYKSNKIVFRGRILSDVSDYWNNKVITCEGEMGFLQDSINRPFKFSGTPEEFLRKCIDEHNSQVDEFKQFKLGIVTVGDIDSTIELTGEEYVSTFEALNTHLVNGSLGGYLFITHGDDGSESMPTINYFSDFTNVSAQTIEFGSNLKNYTKTVKAEEMATAIIPLGKDDLTIAHVNDGLDYVYSPEGVNEYGWIFKTVSWDDVANAITLKSLAEKQMELMVNQNVTIELTAIDLHLLDHSIESFCLGDYIHVISKPHNFDATLLCNKQTIDLLKPENDSLTLGYNYSTFTEKTSSTIQSTMSKANNRIIELTQKTETIGDRVNTLESGEMSAEIQDGVLVLNKITQQEEI